jgi:hypothetical protein
MFHTPAHKTNVTELAGFFPASQQTQAPQRAVAIASRFWLPGDTYEQALQRQQESMRRLQQRTNK